MQELLVAALLHFCPQCTAPQARELAQAREEQCR